MSEFNTIRFIRAMNQIQVMNFYVKYINVK